MAKITYVLGRTLVFRTENCDSKYI